MVEFLLTHLEAVSLSNFVHRSFNQVLLWNGNLQNVKSKSLVSALCSALLTYIAENCNQVSGAGEEGHLALPITTWVQLLPVSHNLITCLHSQYIWNNNNINTIFPLGYYSTHSLNFLIASDFSENKSQITFSVPPPFLFHLFHRKHVTFFLI